MARATIETVMTPFPYSVEIDDQASTAKTLMDQYHIQHMPVREGERYVGILTRPVLSMAEHSGYDFSVGSPVRVRDLYTSDVYVVAVDEPLRNVLQTMAEQHRDAALVLRSGHLAGIFTVSDACRNFALTLDRLE